MAAVVRKASAPLKRQHHSKGQTEPEAQPAHRMVSALFCHGAYDARSYPRMIGLLPLGPDLHCLFPEELHAWMRRRLGWASVWYRHQRSISTGELYHLFLCTWISLLGPRALAARLDVWLCMSLCMTFRPRLFQDGPPGLRKNRTIRP